jgi:hypothetical protein
MARFSMEQWLHDREFHHGTDNPNWWSWPNGLIYLALDLIREGNTCVIYEYRDGFPPRQAIGERKVYTREQYEADTGDIADEAPECWGHSWIEYRFAWPKTRAEAEAIADQMGWNDNPDIPDTPLDEFASGVDTLLNEGREL